MPTPFAELYQHSCWPTMLANLGEAMTYVESATGAEHSVVGVYAPRSDEQTLDVSWEVRLRQAEILIDAVSLDGVAFTPRQDMILARGTSYTVLDRDGSNGAVFRHACEREDVDAISLRGRRY